LADLQYILQQTGSTTNCSVLSKNTVTPRQLNDAFEQGQIAPPAGYVPPADVQVAIDAWRAWKANRPGKKQRGRDG
jgi:hypothetical protein